MQLSSYFNINVVAIIMQDNLLIAILATAMVQQLSAVLLKVDLLQNTLAKLEKTRNFPVSKYECFSLSRAVEVWFV